MQRPAKPPTWVQIPDPAYPVLRFSTCCYSVNNTEVVSSLTHYEGDHLILEYEKGDITLYDLPAGRKEDDEQALEGMIREFREETGLSMLDVDNITALRPYTYVMDENSFEVHPFDIELTKKKDPQGLDSTEHDGYIWLNETSVERAAMDGWLNSPKYFNAKYVEAGMNGAEELRGNNRRPQDLVFRDEEVMDNLDDLEALINSKI